MSNAVKDTSNDLDDPYSLDALPEGLSLDVQMSNHEWWEGFAGDEDDYPSHVQETEAQPDDDEMARRERYRYTPCCPLFAIGDGNDGHQLLYANGAKRDHMFCRFPRRHHKDSSGRFVSQPSRLRYVRHVEDRPQSTLYIPDSDIDWADWVNGEEDDVRVVQEAVRQLRR